MKYSEEIADIAVQEYDKNLLKFAKMTDNE